jgi:transposase
MQLATTISLDIAKSVFQVHGVDAAGQAVIRRQLKRRYVLTFSRSCRHALSVSRPVLPRIIGRALGYSTRLIPPAYVNPYVKRHKNDAADAEAICEAVSRPNMRFVATKTPEQQVCLTLHRTRQLFVRQLTSVINAKLGCAQIAHSQIEPRL